MDNGVLNHRGDITDEKGRLIALIIDNTLINESESTEIYKIRSMVTLLSALYMAVGVSADPRDAKELWREIEQVNKALGMIKYMI